MLVLKCSPTLEEIAAGFLAERRHLKRSTLNKYESVLRTCLLPQFGSIPWDLVDSHAIASYRSELACKAAPRTVNAVIGMLKTMIQWAIARGLCEHDARKLGAMTSVREEVSEIEPFQLEELDRILSCIRPPYRQFFACLAWTGARPSELTALRWRDCSDTEIHINKARVRGHESTPKTRSSNRRITLTPPARAALALQRHYSYSDEHNYVFVNSNGNPMTKHIDLMWRRACERAGVKPRPVYTLRHTFASQMLAAGETPAYVARCLGHSTTETLYRHYARWIPNAAIDGKKIIGVIGEHYGSQCEIESANDSSLSSVTFIDAIDQFLMENTQRGEALRVDAYDLYCAYAAWIQQSGKGKPLNRNLFGRCMSARGFVAQKVARGRFKYLGLAGNTSAGATSQGS